MPHIITRKVESVEQNSLNSSSCCSQKLLQEHSNDPNQWLTQLNGAISDPLQLLAQLEIDAAPWLEGIKARQLFAQRVPQSFVDRMEKGNPHDPLLRQVLPLSEEFEVHEGYSTDPLDEQDNDIPGLLHKYQSRVLMIVKGGCAINCRYCFRRHFPYQDNKGNKSAWQISLDYIAAHPELDEVILSGGDPLMAKDQELQWLVDAISAIEHIKTLRIHTRLPVVIPARITERLCQLLHNTRLQVVMVTHINHANEINHDLTHSLNKLKQIGVMLLNQSVLLKGVNDEVQAQANLSRALFQAGVLPYYLHVLDKVQGAAHFFVSDKRAREIMAGLLTQVSGYLVPKLAREIGGEKSKTPLDLHLS
ncbi:EF-P beta-lysylation protein EpmB [Vibrio sp. S11_S32]|uniref:EF-P beta-lysylation protein EpmB n=1 Tax=Vibrio sp. S11_S32 TaxID=2720225 RepID=UPI0016812D03|nr:EF-P beta-lysylation protein EpmB [Vibrio sp. S11_S32]MBD1575211.1 EF-P beta-lysylation protein EpmB [Vibrio sp. S11_S32]